MCSCYLLISLDSQHHDSSATSYKSWTFKWPQVPVLTDYYSFILCFSAATHSCAVWAHHELWCIVLQLSSFPFSHLSYEIFMSLVKCLKLSTKWTKSTKIKQNNFLAKRQSCEYFHIFFCFSFFCIILTMLMEKYFKTSHIINITSFINCDGWFLATASCHFVNFPTPFFTPIILPLTLCLKKYMDIEKSKNTLIYKHLSKFNILFLLIYLGLFENI